MTCGPAVLRIPPGGANVYEVFDEQRAYIDGQWAYIDGIDAAVSALAVETPAGSRRPTSTSGSPARPACCLISRFRSASRTISA